MRYVVSGLVGFVVTLVISLPVQHLMQIKEARASSLGSSKVKSRAGSRAVTELLVDVPPLAGGIDPKEPRIKFMPQYPTEAAEQQLEGFVVLSFQVGSDGSVQNLKVVESVPPMVFDKAAKRAVSRWSFRPLPAGKDAASADNEQKLRLNFSLKKALASEDSSNPSL
ncbi:energy transducer TonB [Oligoflexus tunisiensis]|uniref:energy transducer TonB n=1 Tax=Oligoflexus tunisiensis TaxID=708132 RepID=UPI00114CD9B7|nr:energy transducer TonB [Oligoflexus tunisiensis]